MAGPAPTSASLSTTYRRSNRATTWGSTGWRTKVRSTGRSRTPTIIARPETSTRLASQDLSSRFRSRSYSAASWTTHACSGASGRTPAATWISPTSRCRSMSPLRVFSFTSSLTSSGFATGCFTSTPSVRQSGGARPDTAGHPLRRGGDWHRSPPQDRWRHHRECHHRDPLDRRRQPRSSREREPAQVSPLHHLPVVLTQDLEA